MHRPVSVIIPAYNRKREVLACIGSLVEIDYPATEVILVDNASTDGTASEVRRVFPHVEVVELPANRGAVAARNEGIRRAKGDYLCFVDSDNVVERGFLTELVAAAEADARIGFAGPKMYFRSDPRRLWYAGVEVDHRTSRTRYRGFDEIDKGQYDRAEDVHHVPNVWLVRKETVVRIGAMNEAYVMTYGEAEWAERARLSGYRVVYCPRSVVYHDIPLPAKHGGLRARIGFDSPYRVYYAARNRTLYMRQFARRGDFLLFLMIYNNLFLLRYCLLLAAGGRPDLVRAYLRGFLDGAFDESAAHKPVA